MRSLESLTAQQETSDTERSIETVVKRADELLGSLDEALESYSEVTIGTSTYEANTPFEQRVARAQRLKEGVTGLVEQLRTGNSQAEVERAALMLEQVVDLYESALKVEADAAAMQGGTKLVLLMNKIALALLPLEEQERER